MGLLETFLLEPTKTNVWIGLRSDAIQGDGTTTNPYDGSPRFGRTIQVSLAKNGNEVLVDTGGVAHGFSEGDMIQIAGITGPGATQWNRAFFAHAIEPTKFKFALITAFFPEGAPTAALVTFQFDKIMRDLPPNTRVNLGPGIFQTRGYAPKGVGSWSPKSGQKIVGSGMDVTTLQLVGAGVLEIDNELVEQHYHAIGTPIVPAPNSTMPVPVLENFDVSNLTIDCNMDNQPLRGQGTFTPVACGALRVLGSHCRVQNVKAINWGTKSLREGCFVISIIGASAQPNDVDGNPVITQGIRNGIENCILIEPSKNCARETTVLHLGGLKNSANHAQAFASACHVRNNFIDCEFKSSSTATQSFGSQFLTCAPGTFVDHQIIAPDIVGLFKGKRPHHRLGGEFIRLSNPRNPASRWNGYFPILAVVDDYSMYFDLNDAVGADDDSSIVIMGAEFRAIAVTSGQAAVVQNNQIHNCWIGGPYQSPLDDSVTDPTSPPTLAREERLDPLNALNTRSLIVRDTSPLQQFSMSSRRAKNFCHHHMLVLDRIARIQ